MNVCNENELLNYPDLDNKYLDNSLYVSKVYSHGVNFNMLLQLHITDFCNLNCVHCYGRAEKKEMTYEDFKCVIDQYMDFLRRHRLSSLINITGGEPLLHTNTKLFLDYLYKYFKEGIPFKVTLLTNGTIVNDDILDMLDYYKSMIFEIQISIDGMEKVHDAIRGVGNWNRAINGIQKLLNWGYRVSMSFVLSKRNYEDIEELLLYAQTIGVYRITVSRLIPLGENKDCNETEVMEASQFKEVQKKIYKIASKFVEDIKNGAGHTYVL